MSAAGTTHVVPLVSQPAMGQEDALIEQLSSISVNRMDPRFDLANRLMAVSFMYKMAECCSKRSLEHIAANTKTPVSMLAQLATNENEEVRMAVAENPSASKDILLLLAKDRQVDVRYSMAENSNLPAEILNILCEDENPFVSTRAAQSIMRKKSCRFTGQFQRLNMACGRATVEGLGIKRFITTLTNLARVGT